jgi:mannose-6-phosphate isomerase-like protein (cupin superfamily)
LGDLPIRTPVLPHHSDGRAGPLPAKTLKEKATMQTAEALAVARGEGEARWWVGMLAEIKATAADTGGRLAVVEVTCGPGHQVPLHVHHREDEAFWILEGAATFQVGDRSIEAGAGDYLFGPRDVPHRFDVGGEGCRMLFILTPGGLEDLIRATSEPAQARTLPPPAPEAPDFDQLKAIVKRYGCELLV